MDSSCSTLEWIGSIESVMVTSSVVGGGGTISPLLILAVASGKSPPLEQDA